MSDFAPDRETAELADAARRFAVERLHPDARVSEREGRWPDDVLGVLAGFSLSGLDVPVALGGDGAGCLAKVVVLEALATGDAGGLPAADQPGRSVGALLACPDDGVARAVAEVCLAGEGQAALVVLDASDPELARIQWAPAWPPVRWVWMTRGDELRLLEGAQTSAQPRPLAFHASGAVDGDLSGASVVGRWTLPRGDGVQVRGRARLWAAAVAVGVAQAAWDATIDYATDRVVFGKPVAHHQGNAFDLASAATNLHGARLAVRDAAAGYDRGVPFAGFHATQAWLTAVDAAIEVTNLGIQLLGGHGFLVDHLAEKRFREARMLAQLAGGRDAADADVAALVLEVPDPVFS